MRTLGAGEKERSVEGALKGKEDVLKYLVTLCHVDKTCKENMGLESLLTGSAFEAFVPYSLFPDCFAVKLTKKSVSGQG